MTAAVLVRGPTSAEVAGEVARLRELREAVPPRTVFGDDNREAITAQIDVLSERLSVEQTEDRWGEHPHWAGDPGSADIAALSYAPYVLAAAVQAAKWLHGHLDILGDSPAASWEGMPELVDALGGQMLIGQEGGGV